MCLDLYVHEFLSLVYIDKLCKDVVQRGGRRTGAMLPWIACVVAAEQNSILVAGKFFVKEQVCGLAMGCCVVAAEKNVNSCNREDFLVTECGGVEQ
jgi:hypothetical protein